MSTGESNKIMEDINNYLNKLGKWMMLEAKVNTNKCQAIFQNAEQTLTHLNYATDISNGATKPNIRELSSTNEQHLKITSKMQGKSQNHQGTALPPLGNNSKLSLSNKLLLYKTLVRSIMSYASRVWGAAAKTHISKLKSNPKYTVWQITNST
ncbi:hypothetical protein AVEN_269628-1 [Araneus ventricosus]|uniref:Uncharacterized protein n=1 Tax=Araneus ventricosus TaxID=182803 RepID=A0A4Y2CQP2_ARAVE|nr:hypothetical protein AVEN_269628-1 [Araneus ventricosus]